MIIPPDSTTLKTVYRQIHEKGHFDIELPVRPMNERLKCYVPSKRDYILESEYVSTIIDSIIHGENIMLLGEQGCGKSALVLYLANLMNIPLIQIQGSGELSEIDLVGGFQHTVEQGMQWMDGKIPFALRNHCWLLIDEINMVLPEVLARLHSVLDDRRHLDLREVNEVIPVSKDTVIFATMNPSNTGRHVGTKPLSPALLSRFDIIVPYEFLSPEKEIDLLVQRTGITNDEAEVMVKVALESRKAFHKGELSELIDTRMLLEWATKTERFKKYYNNGAEVLKETMKSTVLTRFDEDDYEVLKGIVLSFLSLA